MIRGAVAVRVGRLKCIINTIAVIVSTQCGAYIDRVIDTIVVCIGV